MKDEWTNCKALSFLYKCFKFTVLPLGNNFHNGLPGNMICNKILHVNHNYNIQCINVHLHVYNDYIFEFLSEWWFNLPAQLPMIDDWWLMYELALVTWIPMHGANLTCWLCLINCRFDNANIIWHYSREKNLLCSQLLSVKREGFHEVSYLRLFL